jgi:membrane protein implicated in regulation of membrane protease activity
MRLLEFLVIIGLVVAGLFFFGPFILGLLYIVVCGGFAAVSSVAAPLGDALNYIVPGIFILLALLIVMTAIRFAKRKASDRSLQNTVENTLAKNAAYIKEAKARGMSDAEIRAVFKSGGWGDQDTDKAFALASPNSVVAIS